MTGHPVHVFGQTAAVTAMPRCLPRLLDPPVRLRGFTDEDVPLIQEVSTDSLIPLITTVPTTADPELALAFIERQHARLASREGYSFAVADAISDRAYGQIGLWLRDVCHGRASVGYWVAAAYRHRGIATHALNAISCWGLSLPNILRLELYIEPGNEGSWRAAERVGYQREGRLRSWQRVGDHRRDMYLYSLLPSDRPLRLRHPAGSADRD